MSRRIADLVTYLLLGAGAAVILAPYLLSIQTSVKTPAQFAAASPLALPAPITPQAYAELTVGGHTLIPPLVITVQVVILVVLGQLTNSVLAAYAFARLDFPGRDLVFWLYLATLMVPVVATLVPRFVLVSELGLRDTFWGIVLPALFGSPYAIFLLREFFRGIPGELLDAVRIDGAGHLRAAARGAAVAAVASAKTPHRAATEKVLAWIGSAEGVRPIAAGGFAFPGVTAAEPDFAAYWQKQGVDLKPFLDAAKGTTFPAPVGPRVSAGATAAEPALHQVFLGRVGVAPGLRKAQDAANQAITS